MVAFCIPPALAETFKQGVITGEIDPDKLSRLSSEDRRAFLEKYVGPENAYDVNALFESKLILKDQQRGLATWARTVAGLKPAARRDLMSKINKLDKVLQPADEQSFLADLVQQKLGVGVTADEARQIGDAATRVRQLEADWDAEGRDPNSPKRIAWGRAQQNLVKLVDGMKPKPDVLSWNTVDKLWSLPQQMLTSVFHMSGFFVQAANMVSRARAWQGFGMMFKYMWDEEHFQNLNAWIITHKDYDLLQRGGVALNKLGDKLSNQEEYIRGHLVANASHYLSETTGVPDLVRASSRAFTGFLNFVRAKSFYDLIERARIRGEDLGPESHAVRDIGTIVNTFSGRGNLGFDDSLGYLAPALNRVIWAPRKLSGTFGVFNPLTYLKPNMSPTARMEAIKNLTGTMAVTSAIIGLATATGHEISFDPDDPKFLQIPIGNTTFDMGGGDYSYIRMFMRVAKNMGTRFYDYATDTPYHQAYGTPTAIDTITSYLRNKMTPMAAFLVDVFSGKDAVGRPFDPVEEAEDKMLPITTNEMLELFHNDPNNYTALAFSPLSAFGIGMRTPAAPEHMYGMTVWGTPADAFAHPSQDPVDQELLKLKYHAHFPEPMIQGIPLSGDQYRKYIQTSGEKAKISIENDMSLPGWDQYPKEQKMHMIRADIAGARRDAADEVMTEDLSIAPPGQSIMDKATALKEKNYGIEP